MNKEGCDTTDALDLRVLVKQVTLAQSGHGFHCLTDDCLLWVTQALGWTDRTNRSVKLIGLLTKGGIVDRYLHTHMPMHARTHKHTHTPVAARAPEWVGCVGQEAWPH